MYRRTLLMSIFGKAKATSDRKVPVDMATLNSFVERFNAYLRSLEKGIISLEKWKAAERAWEELIK